VAGRRGEGEGAVWSLREMLLADQLSLEKVVAVKVF